MVRASAKVYLRELTHKKSVENKNYPTINKTQKKVINRNLLRKTNKIINKSYKKIEK